MIQLVQLLGDVELGAVVVFVACGILLLGSSLRQWAGLRIDRRARARWQRAVGMPPRHYRCRSRMVPFEEDE